MTVECKTKTITEIKNNKVKISCLSSNQNDTERPTIFRSDILEEKMTLNSKTGIEGELFLTHTDAIKSVGLINEQGDLIITLEDDDPNKYRIEGQNLIYDE